MPIILSPKIISIIYTYFIFDYSWIRGNKCSLSIIFLAELSDVFDWLFARLCEFFLGKQLDVAKDKLFAFYLDAHLIQLVEETVLELFVLFWVLFDFFELESGDSEQFFSYCVVDWKPDGAWIVSKLNVGVVLVAHDVAFAFEALGRVDVDFFLAEVTHFEDNFLFLYSQQVGSELMYLYLMVCTLVLYLSSCCIS